MSKENKIRMLRNKYKQVLLIEGQPDCLFEETERTIYHLIINNKKYNLGHLTKSVANYFKTLGANITEQKVKHVRPVGIPGFSGLYIRKSNANTTIEVRAPTEEILQASIAGISEYLSKNNVPLTERCHWVCTFDKAKDKPETAFIHPDLVNSNPRPKATLEPTPEPVREKKTPLEIKNPRTKQLKEMVIKMGLQ